MKHDLLTGADLARLTGVSRQAISAAEKAGRVHRDPLTKKYDPAHQVNSAYIAARRAVMAEPTEDAGHSITDFPPDQVPADMADLYHQKLAAEVRRLEAQALKYELQVEREKKHLIPTDLMAIWIGHFGTAIRTFVLPIGERVARGDTELRDRIEKEITRGLERAKESAAAALRHEGARLAQALRDAGDPS